MDMYSLHRLAHEEYELRVASLPPVPEDDYVVAERSGKNWRRPVLWLRPILSALLHVLSK